MGWLCIVMPARHDRLALLGLVTARRPEPSFLRWDKMNFKAADTQILLGSGAGETRLEHLDMLLLVQPGKADLPECHASLQGLRIEAKCAFVALAHAGNAEAVAAARQVVQREGLFRDVNLDWLKSVKEGLKFQPEKDEPVLRMELHSLPDDRGMESTMTFDGAKFQWRGQRWDFMQAAVKIPVGKKNSNSPIEIDHVRIGHAGRKAEIAGAFDPASRVIRISKFDSGIDVLALARDMMPDAVGSLSAVSTSGDWRVSGAGEIPVDHPENFRWNGDVALDGDLVYASGANKHRIAEADFFSARGGAGGDHLRSQGGPLGWKSRCGEVAGPSALEGEETAIRSAAHTRRRAIAIDHQQFWRGSEAAWGRSVGLEGRLANQRCGRDPDGSP